MRREQPIDIEKELNRANKELEWRNEKLKGEFREANVFSVAFSRSTGLIPFMILTFVMIFYFYIENMLTADIIKQSKELGDMYFIDRVEEIHSFFLYVVFPVAYLLLFYTYFEESIVINRNHRYYKDTKEKSEKYKRELEKYKKDFEAYNKNPKFGRKPLEPIFSLDSYERASEYDNVEYVMQRSVIAVFSMLLLFLPFLSNNTVELKEYKGSFEIESVHYAEGSYVVFYEENNFIKKLIIPDFVNVNIRTTKNKDEKETIDYLWRTHFEGDRGLLKEKHSKYLNNYYAEITLKEDTGIKGSLLN